MATNITHTDDIYDSVVIGAGVEGSATAYKLAESGQRTLLLEQFELLHTNGSSHGGSRIIRHSYAKKCFSDLVYDAFGEWRKVEKLCGQKVYVKAGIAIIGLQPGKKIDPVVENLRRKNVPHSLLANGEELRKVMPNTSYSDDHCGVYEPTGGILRASRAVGCLHELVRKFGGEIVDKCEVVDIEPGTVITLRTNDGRVFRTKNLVICAGTWTRDLAKKVDLHLPVTLRRIFVTYWKEKEVGTYTPENGMPCFIDTEVGCYGIPSLEHPGYYKLTYDGGYDYELANSKEHEDKSPYKYDVLVKYIQDNFPELDLSNPPLIEKCKYTMTPDETYILDRHPKQDNIFVGTGFSGSGFKMAPAVGIVLRDFVLRQQQKYDLTSFRLDRFNTTKPSTH